MLSEWQRNIVVALTLAGRTAQYIADRFDCSISTIRRIRNRYRETSRWQRLPGSVVVQRRLQPVMSAILEGLQSAPDFAHWLKSQRRLLHTLEIQFPKELPREGSMVRQSTTVVLYKNRTLVSRTGSDDDDGVPEPLTGQYQTTGPAYFSPMNQGSTLHIVTGWLGYGEQPEINTYVNVYAWSIEIESFL